MGVSINNEYAPPVRELIDDSGDLLNDRLPTVVSAHAAVNIEKPMLHRNKVDNDGIL